jgi:hypothetical protein
VAMSVPPPSVAVTMPIPMRVRMPPVAVFKQEHHYDVDTQSEGGRDKHQPPVHVRLFREQAAAEKCRKFAVCCATDF